MNIIELTDQERDELEQLLLDVTYNTVYHRTLSLDSIDYAVLFEILVKVEETDHIGENDV